MSKSIRIRTQPNSGDKFVKIKLDQTFDFLEILSLKLSQEELYRIFAADYGVIVGRVIANRGFGVPNAKVSVFVPLDDNETDPEIIGRYPYKQVSDRNDSGIRYNLLEDIQQSNCHRPVGTFPNKRKMLDNDVWLEIYDTYYKYTTTTNDAGDFMIFGVPTGNQKLHMDVDVSDIGFISIKPYDLIKQGYTPNLFESNTTYKGGTDLDTLVQVQSRDFNVNVLPFWGDLEENEVGINRVDFNLNIDITPTAQFFGSIFSEQRNKGVFKRCTPRKTNGENCELKSGVGQVEYIRRISNDSNEVEFFSSNETKIDENGNWAILVPMNLNPVVTDEFGDLIPSEDPTIGIPTEAQVRFRAYMDEYRFGFRKRTANYLIPNMYNRFQFGVDTEDDDFFTMRWKKAYTVTNYIPRYQKNQNDESKFFTGIKKIGECEKTTSFPYNRIDTNTNILYNILCIVLSAIAIIIDLVNNLITAILFGIILKFSCFLKHPFNSDRRSACRCQACSNLSTELDGDFPADWDGSINDGSIGDTSVDDRIECAVCYDGNGDVTYGLSVGYDLTASITTNSGDATTSGTFSASTSGSGDDATFTVTVAGGSVTSIIVNTGGAGYKAGDSLTFSTADIGGTTNVVIASIPSAALTTSITVNGVTVDCSLFDYEICGGLCQTCDTQVIPLSCNNTEYETGDEWVECVKEGLAEELGVIVYEFYNDWIIGSLYSYMFDYKVRTRRRRKTIEKFCDYECRPQSVAQDPDDEHRKNKCKTSYIIEKEEWNNSSSVKKTIDTPSNGNPGAGDSGRGLIVEYNDFLYYSARNDIEINLSGATDLSVEDKDCLLFATNIIELGSVVSCDLDGEPFVIDRLEPTTHQTDDGVGTLFNVNNCIAPVQDINFNGIQLISQAGVDILVAETERTSATTFDGDDDESYTIVGSETGLPDYDGNSSIIILDRDDVILRQLLCENFNYFSVNGTYSTTSHPTGGDNITDDDGDIVESTTDTCAGFDDIRDDVTYFPSDNMPPYYMYFGVTLGQTALDKLKDLYYDNCID